MHADTRQKLNTYYARIAELNHVDSVKESFNVSPQLDEKIERKIQETSDFLQRINFVSVDNQKGKKVGIAATSTVAGRTDTSVANSTGRKTQDPTGISDRGYACEQTDYDTHLHYAKLDAWRHDPNFQTKLQQAVNEQIGRDRLMIAFNGEEVAANTDRVANPLLQDVNIGWIKSQEQAKAGTVISGVRIGKLKDGTGGDHNNLDAAVYDALNDLIEPQHQNDTGLVVICGRKLISDKNLTLLNDADKATEKKATDDLVAKKLLGGLPVIIVPFFPADAFMITSLDNLSIYVQRGTTRRYFQDNPKFNQIEEYRSMNEAFVVENHDKCCVVKGILMPDNAGTAWA